MAPRGARTLLGPPHLARLGTALLFFPALAPSLPSPLLLGRWRLPAHALPAPSPALALGTFRCLPALTA